MAIGTKELDLSWAQVFLSCSVSGPNLPHVLVHNFGSNCPSLENSTFGMLRTFACCYFLQHRDEFAIHKNKMHTKIKWFTVLAQKYNNYWKLKISQTTKTNMKHNNSTWWWLTFKRCVPNEAFLNQMTAQIDKQNLSGTTTTKC